MTLVTVLSVESVPLLALAKSLLQAEGIPFVAQGEALQTLFGAGPVEVQVLPIHAGWAWLALQEPPTQVLQESPGGS